MKTLRTKLLIGLAPTLAILLALGLWAIAMFHRLGGNIDVILRENYTSILAAEKMKEAIERMDSGLLFAVGGRDEYGRNQFEANRPRFLEQLQIEHANITLPGEKELAEAIESQFSQYIERCDRFFGLPAERRANVYFQELLPIFNKIRESADGVLALNQENMAAMDRQARTNAAMSIRLMTGALIAAVALAVLALMVLSRSIEKPIQAVTDGARCSLGASSTRSYRQPLETSSENWPLRLTIWPGPCGNIVSPGLHGSCVPRRRPRPRSTPFPIPWSWSIRSARSSKPIEPPGVCSAWSRPPNPPFPGSPPSHSKRS